MRHQVLTALRSCSFVAMGAVAIAACGDGGGSSQDGTATETGDGSGTADPGDGDGSGSGSSGSDGSDGTGSTDDTGSTGEDPPDPVPGRGYQPRPCGLDLDHDGVRGEAEDCAVCDATVSGGNLVAGSEVAGA
ncbi:MAG: hypothetical protein ACYTGC_20550, partial [Planctomycetota bacterium]